MKKQLILMGIAAFFGMLAYPFTRTSAAPYFNAAYGANNLSYAMLASIAFAAIIILIYNRLAKKYALLHLFVASNALIVVVNLFFGLVMGHHPKWMALIFYAWSDIYVLIFVEQFWSVMNALSKKEMAQKYYGALLACGAIGAFVGNVIVARFVKTIGASNIILLSCISLTILWLFIYLFHRSIKAEPELLNKLEIEPHIAKTSIVGGASLVYRSRYLFLLAGIVFATQIYINGAYFIFNNQVAKAADIVTSQSALYGKAFSFVEVVSIFINLVLSPFLLKRLGVARTHYSILTTIICLFFLMALSPALSIVAVFFIAAKSFDYSIFRAAKELFYVPLTVAEKFQAKQFIDIFIYRLSKGVAAFGIILIHNILHYNVIWLVFFGILLWMYLIISILKIYKTKEIQ